MAKNTATAVIVTNLLNRGGGYYEFALSAWLASSLSDA